MATPERIRGYEKRVHKQHYAQDLLLAPVGAASGNDDDDDDDDDDKEVSNSRRARDVMTLIVLFTGPKNWDYVGSLGNGGKKDGND